MVKIVNSIEKAVCRPSTIKLKICRPGQLHFFKSLHIVCFLLCFTRPHYPCRALGCRTLTLTRFNGAGECGKSLYLLLVHDRADIPERRMQSLSMVKHRQILKDRVASLSTRVIGLLLHALGLQGADETLHERIVVAIPFTAPCPLYSPGCHSKPGAPGSPDR